MSQKVINHKKVFIILLSTITFIMITSLLLSFSHNHGDVLLNLNNTFTLKIPGNINYKKEDYVTGKEITQHFVLTEKNNSGKISGFIQVRKLSSTIENYMTQSEQNFSASIYDYTKKPVLQNGNTGFEISFKIKGDSYDTAVIQTLWQKGTDMYILSLSSPLKDSDYLEKTFYEIRNSVTLSGDSLPSGKLTAHCIRYN